MALDHLSLHRRGLMPYWEAHRRYEQLQLGHVEILDATMSELRFPANGGRGQF